MAQVALPNFTSGLRQHSGEALNAIIACGDAFLAGILKGANMNTTADQAIPISLPGLGAGGSGRYNVQSVLVANPSISLTTAAGGIYTAPSKGGVAVVDAGQAYAGLTTNANNTNGALLNLTIALSTAILVAPILYFALTTPQGALATADIYVIVSPLP